jgi:hypothetical protein
MQNVSDVSKVERVKGQERVKSYPLVYTWDSHNISLYKQLFGT